MNYSQLCQRMIAECGISGLSSFTTVQSPVGETERVASWIREAWREIQIMHEDWRFMRASYLNPNSIGSGVSFATVAGQAVYQFGTGPGTLGIATTAFKKWDRNTFRTFSTLVGNTGDEVFLDWIPYDTWRDGYMYGPLRSVQTRPMAFAIAPDNSICLGPPPNGNYTVEGDYWVNPQTLTQDSDVPQGMPERYQMLIVYRAMMKYAGYESAPEVDGRAKQEYGPLYRELEAEFAPGFCEGIALA